MTKTAKTRTVKDPAVRRAEIVEVARELFQTKGYEKTTTQDVMATLDIAKGTIYHYFPSKEALFEAVVHDMVAKNSEYMESLVHKMQGTALEKMQMLIKAGNMAAEHGEMLEVLHQRNDTLHIRLLAATLVQQAALYAKIIQQGCDEGVFKTEYPLECAEFVLSAVQFLTDVGIYPWTHEDLQRRADALPRLIEQQLQAPKGSFQFLKDHMNGVEDMKMKGKTIQTKGNKDVKK